MWQKGKEYSPKSHHLTSPRRRMYSLYLWNSRVVNRVCRPRTAWHIFYESRVGKCCKILGKSWGNLKHIARSGGDPRQHYVYICGFTIITIFETDVPLIHRTSSCPAYTCRSCEQKNLQFAIMWSNPSEFWHRTAPIPLRDSSTKILQSTRM